MNTPRDGIPATRPNMPERAPALNTEAARQWAKAAIGEQLESAQTDLRQISARREGVELQITALAAQMNDLNRQLETHRQDEASAAAATTDIYRRQQQLDNPETTEANINFAIFGKAVSQNLAISNHLQRARNGARFDPRHFTFEAIIAALLSPTISARLPDAIRQQMERNLSQIAAFGGIDEGFKEAMKQGLLPYNDTTNTKFIELQTKLSALYRQSSIQEVLRG